jgi:hypothetical protein
VASLSFLTHLHFQIKILNTLSKYIVWAYYSCRFTRLDQYERYLNIAFLADSRHTCIYAPLVDEFCDFSAAVNFYNTTVKLWICSRCMAIAVCLQFEKATREGDTHSVDVTMHIPPWHCANYFTIYALRHPHSRNVYT